VLYRNGIAVAVLESGDVHFLTEVEPDQRWLLQQLLLSGVFSHDCEAIWVTANQGWE
jgi:phosphate-selective porin